MISRKEKFSLVDLVVVLCVAALGLSLLSPALVRSREEDRIANCKNKMRQLCLGVLNKESATIRFPLAMFGKASASHINKRGPLPFSAADGYSWIVPILPYCEETALFDELAERSEMFSLPMNSKTMKKGDKWIHAEAPEFVICPTTDDKHRFVRGKLPKSLGKAEVSNYMALVAGCVDGSRGTYGDINPTTGGLIVTKRASPKGLKIGDCKDGTSKTAYLAESKAELYSFWFSGVGTSTVSMPPDLVQCSRIARNKPDGFSAPKAGIPSAVNYGRDRTAKDGKWFSESYVPGPRDWGASSRHIGGRVNHGFMDGHVSFFTKEIDPTAYFRLTTRGGGEPVDSKAVELAAKEFALAAEERSGSKESSSGSSSE